MGERFHQAPWVFESMPFHWEATLRDYAEWLTAKREWDDEHPKIAGLEDVPWDAETFKGEMT